MVNSEYGYCVCQSQMQSLYYTVGSMDKCPDFWSVYIKWTVPLYAHTNQPVL